jgi:hypothetical protein
MESAVAGTSSVTNIRREDTQNLAVQNVDMRKESVTVGAGTESPDPVVQDCVIAFQTGTDKSGMNITTQEMECSSLQHNSIAKCSNTITDEICIMNSIINSEIVDVHNTVPFNSVNENSMHDQTVVNIQAPYSVTEITDNTHNDVSNVTAIAANLEISGEQLESSPVFTAAGVILDSSVEGCHQSTNVVGDVTVDVRANDGVNDGDMMVANTVVDCSAIYGACRGAKKEENRNRYTNTDFEKADYDGHDAGKPTEPCHDSLKDRSDISEDWKNCVIDIESGRKCDFVVPEVPVMVHQASQTDLEECIEDSDGLRFILIPQKPVVTTAAVGSKLTPAINAVNKTTAAGRSPVASPRVGVRTSLASTLRPQPSLRPAYASVSRLNSPANLRNQAPSHTSLTAPRPTSTPRLVRSRTSADVMSARRGTAVRKLPVEPTAVVLKSQRPTLVSRQVKKCCCLDLWTE